MYFCVNEFDVVVNDSIFSGNEQQKVYYRLGIIKFQLGKTFLLKNAYDIVKPFQ